MVKIVRSYSRKLFSAGVILALVITGGYTLFSSDYKYYLGLYPDKEVFLFYTNKTIDVLGRNSVYGYDLLKINRDNGELCYYQGSKKMGCMDYLVECNNNKISRSGKPVFVTDKYDDRIIVNFGQKYSKNYTLTQTITLSQGGLLFNAKLKALSVKEMNKCRLSPRLLSGNKGWFKLNFGEDNIVTFDVEGTKYYLSWSKQAIDVFEKAEKDSKGNIVLRFRGVNIG